MSSSSDPVDYLADDPEIIDFEDDYIRYSSKPRARPRAPWIKVRPLTDRSLLSVESIPERDQRLRSEFDRLSKEVKEVRTVTMNRLGEEVGQEKKQGQGWIKSRDYAFLVSVGPAPASKEDESMSDSSSGESL